MLNIQLCIAGINEIIMSIKREWLLFFQPSAAFQLQRLWSEFSSWCYKTKAAFQMCAKFMFCISELLKVVWWITAFGCCSIWRHVVKSTHWQHKNKVLIQQLYLHQQVKLKSININTMEAYTRRLICTWAWCSHIGKSKDTLERFLL